MNPLVPRNHCDFPGCTEPPRDRKATRCREHEDVRISASYLNETEVKDE